MCVAANLWLINTVQFRSALVFRSVFRFVLRRVLVIDKWARLRLAQTSTRHGVRLGKYIYPIYLFVLFYNKCPVLVSNIIGNIICLKISFSLLYFPFSFFKTYL